MTAEPTRTIRWGIMGCSRVFRRRWGPALQNVKGADIVALASRSPEKAHTWAADLQIPRAYGSYEELLKDKEIDAGVRFRGGATRRLMLPLAQPAWELRQTSSEVITEIDTLLNDYTEGQIAGILNERGYVSGEGKTFHPMMVKRLRRDYGLKTRYDRLRETGMLRLDEMADLIGISTQRVKIWRDRGLLRAHAYNDKNECLYEHPGDNPPVKQQGRKLSKRRRYPEVASNPTKEVQCET